MASYRKEFDEFLKILRYTKCDSATVADMYSKIAPTYDQERWSFLPRAHHILDLVTSLAWANWQAQDCSSISYREPRIVAEELASRMDKKDARIIDLAAGTGLLGEELAKLGFTNVDALEPCSALMQIARKKNVYSQFIQAYLGTERLTLEDVSYEAVVSSGSFFPNHVDETCLDEIIRITKPGGLMIFMVRVRYTEMIENVERRIEELQNQGSWKLLTPDDVRSGIDFTDVPSKMYCLQRN